SAHVVLLSLRAADGERPGPRCVRRGDVGAVLRVSGVQPDLRLDAHLERGGQHRRVSGNGGAARRPDLLPPRRSRAAGPRPHAHRPLQDRQGLARRSFTVYYTAHGPVVRRQGDRWVTVVLMQSPVNALIQSYTRTKARDYGAFRRIMELHTNSSNNTVFADAQGNIAYLHSNYIPRRDTAFDWTEPV